MNLQQNDSRVHFTAETNPSMTNRQQQSAVNGRNGHIMKDQDIISIRNLQLPQGVIAPTIWGEEKVQPATTSLSLTLRDGIGSSADSDALDNNTIHYGQLAKAVRESCSSTALQLVETLSKITDVVDMMARRPGGSTRIGKMVVEICLPKASMYGEAIAFTATQQPGESTRMVFAIRGMKIMTLIGVNANERQARQPLFVDLELTIRAVPWGGSSNAVGPFAVESKLYDIIEDTSFETLEALAVHTVDRLRELFTSSPDYEALRLVISKPRAIAFADAPSIELCRSLIAN